MSPLLTSTRRMLVLSRLTFYSCHITGSTGNPPLREEEVFSSRYCYFPFVLSPLRPPSPRYWPRLTQIPAIHCAVALYIWIGLSPCALNLTSSCFSSLARCLLLGLDSRLLNLQGTAVVFDETIDLDLTRIDGGGAINTSTLPRDPKNGCKPVYPYQYVKTNNIFEVRLRD